MSALCEYVHDSQGLIVSKDVNAPQRLHSCRGALFQIMLMVVADTRMDAGDKKE
jgi:hypothetical protein